MDISRFKRGEIYHLIAERGNYTLCGLRISVFNTPTKRFSHDKPTGEGESETLCKHCERIEKQG